MRRCEAIRSELSAPTGAVGATELAGHLSACPSCASWADEVRSLDALWNNTRLEASEADDDPEGWDAAWAKIAPAAEAVRRERDDQRARSRSIWLCVGIAQAAALMLAFGLWWRSGREEIAVADQQPAAEAPPALTIDLTEGELWFLHVGKDGMRVETTLVDEDDLDLVAADFQILNHMEGLAP